ncbi:tRNA nuclease WapA [Mycobacterium simulans]|nr:tRNA nuclease WapA [Mycobacterium simulans]
MAAIAEAEADDFSVGEDLSVTDNYVRGSADERAARQAAAMGHRNYIAHHAALLHAENQRIAAQLNTGAVQMAGMAPAHWRQPVSEFGQPVPRSSGVATSGSAIMENRKGAIHAVDNHTWRREPAPPEPPLEPANMSAAQALKAYEDLKRDMARYSDRCLRRPFVLPQERAAFDACVADSGVLNARKAALEARLRSLGVQVEPALSPAHGPPETTDTPPFPPPTRISGFTSHGAEQVNGRDGHGVNDRALQDAVANPIGPPKFEPDQYGGTYKYVGKDATVALNKDGQVVTAWANSRNGWRNP